MKYLLAAALAVGGLVLVSHGASAQSLDEILRRLDALEKKSARLEAVEKKNAILERENAELRGRVGRIEAKPVVAAAKAGTVELDKNGHTFLEHKRGNPLTFYTPGGEITAYGNFDVSFDYTTKNAKTLQLNGSTPPTGNFGWMPAISTNLSYLGVRGFQRIGDQPFDFVYQFEAGIEISSMPGTRQSNSNLSNGVNGAIFSRNTYIGLASRDSGAIKIGKTDAPYKNSTAMFNPFSGMLGDYAVIMGNSGGDNRVEFGTRINHAIWYESPTVGGFQFNVLFAPGQNRSSTSDNVPSGEPDCAGGNDPSSGGNFPVACNDGSFSNVVSANLNYRKGPLLIIGAYELHQKVNRQSDINAIYGGPVAAGGNFGLGNSINLFNQDVANEWAAKFGALYTFPTKTTIGGIFEMLRRPVPAALAFQNERSRNGTWFFVSQELTEFDSLHFGWAHAFRTPGDPGQHNDSTLLCDGGLCTFAPTQNQADMVTMAYKRMLSSNLTWYVDVAATFNGPSAHFDLGAGGRAVTTDCHDAFSTSGGVNSAPRCYTGTTLLGVSSGLKWTF